MDNKNTVYLDTVFANCQNDTVKFLSTIVQFLATKTAGIASDVQNDLLKTSEYLVSSSFRTTDDSRNSDDILQADIQIDETPTHKDVSSASLDDDIIELDIDVPPLTASVQQNQIPAPEPAIIDEFAYAMKVMVKVSKYEVEKYLAESVQTLTPPKETVETIQSNSKSNVNEHSQSPNKDSDKENAHSHKHKAQIEHDLSPQTKRLRESNNAQAETTGPIYIINSKSPRATTESVASACQLKPQDDIRRLVDAINASKQSGNNLLELFAKTVTNNTALLKQTGQFSEYLHKHDTMLQRYNAIINSVNAKTITTADTELFDYLCADIKQEQINLIAHIQTSQKALSEAAAKRVTVAVPAMKSDTLFTAATTDIKYIGSEKRLSHYNALINFYQKYTALIKPFVDDPKMKKFRFDCHKCVNLPLNSISIGNPRYLQDKYSKLCKVLRGDRVLVGDTRFSARDQPLGLQYCSYLLAKKLIEQGATVVGSHYEAAFPLAALSVALWQFFPDVRKLFLAMLYMECPLFVPAVFPASVVKSGNAIVFGRYLGYKLNETEVQYLKRISGLQRLYSAVMISHLKQNQRHFKHPYGLENGWVWLTNFIKLEPQAGVCSTLLLEFLQICGFDMWQANKSSFFDSITLLHTEYMSKLRKVDAGGPFSRLADYVTAALKTKRVSPPNGTLHPSYW